MGIVYTILADEQTVERERRPTSDLKQHFPTATTLTETLNLIELLSAWTLSAWSGRVGFRQGLDGVA